MVTKLAPAKRPGTRLIAKRCIAMRGPAYMGQGQTLHGLFDPATGVYQCGGVASRFIYHARRLVSLDASIWRKIEASVQQLEFVDHTENVVYQTDVDSARAYGQFYVAGIGERWGIKLEAFDVLDARGRVVTHRTQRKPEVA